MQLSVFQFLAAGVAVLHALVIAAVVLGVVSIVFHYHLRYPQILLGLGTLLVLAGSSRVFADGCFLTQWEQALRSMYNPETAYSGSFLRHYLQFLGIFISEANVITLGNWIGGIVSLACAEKVIVLLRERRR